MLDLYVQFLTHPYFGCKHLLSRAYMQEKNVECKISIAKPYYGSLFFRKYINRIGHFKKNTQANMQPSCLIAYRVNFKLTEKYLSLQTLS